MTGGSGCRRIVAKGEAAPATSVLHLWVFRFVLCDFLLCGLRGVKVTGAREMKNFLSENLGTIVVLMMVIAVVAAVVWNMSRRKRSGKSGCECMDCPSRKICRSNK